MFTAALYFPLVNIATVAMEIYKSEVTIIIILLLKQKL